MTPEAERIQMEALHGIAARLKTTIHERGHTLAQATRAMDLASRNTVYRMLHHGEAHGNYGRTYEPVTTITRIASAMDYCGISWADLGERQVPANMSEIESLIRALPGLDAEDARTVSNVLQTLVLSLRESRGLGRDAA